MESNGFWWWPPDPYALDRLVLQRDSGDARECPGELELGVHHVVIHSIRHLQNNIDKILSDARNLGSPELL